MSVLKDLRPNVSVSGASELASMFLHVGAELCCQLSSKWTKVLLRL